MSNQTKHLHGFASSGDGHRTRRMLAAATIRLGARRDAPLDFRLFKTNKMERLNSGRNGARPMGKRALICHSSAALAHIWLHSKWVASGQCSAVAIVNCSVVAKITAAAGVGVAQCHLPAIRKSILAADPATHSPPAVPLSRLRGRSCDPVV